MDQPQREKPWWRSPTGIVTIGFLAVAGFFLVTEHAAHLFGALPWLFLATTGIYAHVRHPQYDGFVLIMFGFLLQRPTLLTLAMFPVLVFMYVRLARAEEREALAAFGDAYRRYMRDVPAFFPRFRDFLYRPRRGPA